MPGRITPIRFQLPSLCIRTKTEALRPKLQLDRLAEGKIFWKSPKACGEENGNSLTAMPSQLHGVFYDLDQQLEFVALSSSSPSS